jgi:hypothetical protein
MGMLWSGPIGTRRLTDKTKSLATDVGMYVSQVFLRNHPSLKWEQPLGSKNYVDYGQPVVGGFGEKRKGQFNPVGIMLAHAATHEFGGRGPKPPLPTNRALFGCVPDVVDPCWSSKGSPLPRCNFVLHQSWSRLPHENRYTPHPNFACLATLRPSPSGRRTNLSFPLLHSSVTDRFALLPAPRRAVLPVCASPHSSGTSRHLTFPPLNLHRARVRRNHGWLRSHGFIERAPEDLAPVLLFGGSAPPIKH